MATDIETQTTLHRRSTRTDDDDPNQLTLYLKYQGKRYTFVWKGIDVALKPPPTVRHVLQNFRMSCSSDTSNFEDWCSELGYDPDSIRSLKFYRAVKKEQVNIRRLFGQDYQRFMTIVF